MEIRPVRETIYVDRERGIPLHATILDNEDRVFEIDYDDWRLQHPVLLVHQLEPKSAVEQLADGYSNRLRDFLT